MQSDTRTVTNRSRLYVFTGEEVEQQKNIVRVATLARRGENALTLNGSFLLPVTNVVATGTGYLTLTDVLGCHRIRVLDSWKVCYDDGRGSAARLYLCDDGWDEDRNFWSGRTKTGERVIESQTPTALYITAGFSRTYYQKAGVVDSDAEQLGELLPGSELVYLQPEIGAVLLAKISGTEFSLSMGSALIRMEGELLES